jgi:hypothetical protein
LIFDYSKLQRLSKIYELSIDVKVGTLAAGVADVADVADVGLDKHLGEQSDYDKIAGSEQEKENFLKKAGPNNENIASEQSDNAANPSSQVPQAPHVPPLDDKEYSSTAATTEEHQIPDSIYRAYGDTWKCHNCNTKGDKWFMIKHDCKGQLKPKSERR